MNNPVSRIGPLVVLLAGATGCGLGFDEAPVDAYLPDDDSAGDDDSDDDDIAPDPRGATGTLLEIREGETERWIAAFSFHDDVGAPFAEYRYSGAIPIPGISLHPELRPKSPPECVLTDSAAIVPGLPGSAPVGGVVTLQSGGEAPSRPLEQDDRGLYAGSGEGPLPAAGAWDLALKGGGGWPSGSLGADLRSPGFILDILPRAGALGSLDEIHFRWTQGVAGEAVELLLVRFDGIDPDGWIAVRCTGDDVGEMRVRASALAPAGGPVHVWASRAHWAARVSSGDDARLDVAVVRTLHYEMTL
jgi:hypothetical protein